MFASKCHFKEFKVVLPGLAPPPFCTRKKWESVELNFGPTYFRKSKVDMSVSTVE